MRVVGIVGGIGPESTVEYYKQIIASFTAASPDGDYPRIILNSVNLKEMLGLVVSNEREKLIGLRR